jgi:hypothetical protein
LPPRVVQTVDLAVAVPNIIPTQPAGRHTRETPAGSSPPAVPSRVSVRSAQRMLIRCSAARRLLGSRLRGVARRRRRTSGSAEPGLHAGRPGSARCRRGHNEVPRKGSASRLSQRRC